MTTDFRALCIELADAYLRTLEHINNSTWLGYEPSDDLLLQRTRAALADEPAVPEGKKPTRDELWELCLAAALRALAGRINGADGIRQDVFAIVAELEDTNG